MDALVRYICTVLAPPRESLRRFCARSNHSTLINSTGLLSNSTRHIKSFIAARSITSVHTSTVKTTRTCLTHLSSERQKFLKYLYPDLEFARSLSSSLQASEEALPTSLVGPSSTLACIVAAINQADRINRRLLLRGVDNIVEAFNTTRPTVGVLVSIAIKSTTSSKRRHVYRGVKILKQNCKVPSC